MKGKTEKIKVTIAQTQGHIADSHFGEADVLLFYTVDTAADESVFERNEENPIKKLDEQGHGSQEKLTAAAKVLEGRQVIVSGQPSPNFKKLRKNTAKSPWWFAQPTMWSRFLQNLSLTSKNSAPFPR